MGTEAQDEEEVHRDDMSPMTTDELDNIDKGRVGCRCARLLDEVRRLRIALADEREACAKVADAERNECQGDDDCAAERIARNIHARGA